MTVERIVPGHAQALDYLTRDDIVYLVGAVNKRLAEDGDHLVWTGSTGGASRNPIIKTRKTNKTIPVRRWMQWWAGELTEADVIVTCDRERCVKPSHLANRW